MAYILIFVYYELVYWSSKLKNIVIIFTILLSNRTCMTLKKLIRLNRISS